MKDIAVDIGLSTGMLYLYFTGKRDILNFLFKGTLEPEFITEDHAFPLEASHFEGLSGHIEVAFRTQMERFAGHKDAGADYPPELMLSDAFDVISRYGIACLLIEKNEKDMGTLANLYREYRRSFFDQVLWYTEGYILDGRFRNLDRPEQCARLMIETLSWWGMHLANDSFEPQLDLSPDVAKSVCLDALTHAYGS